MVAFTTNQLTREYYDALCPRGLQANIEYRRELYNACIDDPTVRLAVMEACKVDPLFFIATFGWLQEVRDAPAWMLEDPYNGVKEIPFIPREYQADGIMEAAGALGKMDILSPKSRETGVTWMFMVLAAWDWLFHGASIGFASRDEDSVYSDAEGDSLFAKFMFFLEKLPKWMNAVRDIDWKLNISSMTIRHLESGATITGVASGPNIFRSGRKKWVLLDEAHFFPSNSDYLARDSLVGVTHCRVMISTLNRARGQAGAFWDAWQDEDAHRLLLIIDWKDDPLKRRGLYTSTDNELEILDKEFWAPYFIAHGRYSNPMKPDEEYEFITDEKVRSLYYDYENRRAGVTSQTLAAELDRDVTGATAMLCDAKVLKKAELDCIEPLTRGTLLKTPIEIGPNGRQIKPKYPWMVNWEVPGECRLYEPLDLSKPLLGEYAMGADIAAGTGGSWSSYSCLAVFDRRTGKQVFDWRSNQMNPIVFASIARCIGRIFNSAYFCPEVNGPLGTLFRNELMRLGYTNIYRQRRARQPDVETPDAGYWNNDRGVELITTFEAALKSGEAVCRSALCIREMGRYFYKGGQLVQAAAQSDEDEGAQGQAHGDMAIAMSAAWWAMKMLPEIPEEEKQVEIPHDSFQARRNRARARQRKEGARAYWNPKYR